MRARWILVAMAGASLFLGACGDDDDNGDAGSDGATAPTQAESEDEPMVVDLEAQGDSGVPGTATFTPEGDDQLMVSLELEDDESAEPHPAHVHAGTCEKFDQAPTYPLENVEDGSSETTIDATLADLRGTPLIVNVHESEANIGTYIACGPLG